MNKEEIEVLIQLLQKYELSIALLYETFASILPLSQKAWTDFAKEEHLHAKWISQLYTQLPQEHISFEQTKFTVQSTKTAIAFLENQIDQIKKDKPDLIRVLRIAINIEKALLESAFLKVFKLQGPKAQQIQARLREATELHINRLNEWQASIRKE